MKVTMPLLKLVDYSLVKFLRALKNLRGFRALKTFKDICGQNTHFKYNIPAN